MGPEEVTPTAAVPGREQELLLLQRVSSISGGSLGSDSTAEPAQGWEVAMQRLERLAACRSAEEVGLHLGPLQVSLVQRGPQLGCHWGVAAGPRGPGAEAFVPGG